MMRKVWLRRLKRGRGREHWWRHRLEFGAMWGLARLLGAKPCSDPVFVVGCGHSGTSLVMRVLGEHSAFCAVPYESRCAWSWAPDVVRWKFDL
ncbi:MAG: sulfotransferase, partial [Kiritimatiellaeota bacterium]|nr:sulfotransferase [Kiritimatiellota bacterium]